MTVLIIGFLFIWLITLLGWLVETIYTKLLLKNIRQEIKQRIEWLEENGGENARIETWYEALTIFKGKI